MFVARPGHDAPPCCGAIIAAASLEVNRGPMDSLFDTPRIDMHTHSTFSDGVHPPAALIDMAKAKGLSGIALTDHDSMEGFAELKAAASTHGLHVITGVELSCEYNSKDLHVLGYGVDPANVRLQS